MLNQNSILLNQVSKYIPIISNTIERTIASIYRILSSLTVIVGGVTLLVAAIASLNWRLEHDSPLMVYAGWLTAQGYVPYRDFFDMNMPGTYFLMAIVGELFQWSELGFRVFDLIGLTSISIASYLSIRQFGTLPAVLSTISFPLWYLTCGPSSSLQREYLALIPFSWLFFLAGSPNALQPKFRSILAGMLTSFTVLIKPQFIVVTIPIVIYLIYIRRKELGLWRMAFGMMIGFAVPILATVAYLIINNGIGSFIDIVVHYLPLYSQMTGTHTTIGGFDRMIYLIRSSSYMIISFYLPMSIVGLMTINRTNIHSSYAWMVAGLVCAAIIYPSLSGQFWGYHWIPFYYIVFNLIAVAFVDKSQPAWNSGEIARVIAVALMIFHLAGICQNKLENSWKGNGGLFPPKKGVPDEIARFLISNLRPGDSVQPLDWAGGAIHGMLLARAVPATSFLYDFHFYHHVNDPYIYKLKATFLKELVRAHPRFIIQVQKRRSWPNGVGTTKEFKELDEFLGKEYKVVLQNPTYRILERSQSKQFVAFN